MPPEPDTAPDAGRDAAPAPRFAPLERASLPDQVYEQLLGQIGAGRLKVGERLPSEPRLARALGVSRPSVRLALARLRADGVIASRQGAGSFVLRRPSATFLATAPRGAVADLLRCFEVRIALEGEAAALAARRRTQADLATLKRAAARVAEEREAEDAGADADFAFHAAVAQATGNHMFRAAMDLLRGPLADGIATARRLAQRAAAERRPFMLAEHAAILGAIRDARPEDAREAMRAHIVRSRDGMLGLTD